jgi:AcrR family transcriptional regulator
MSSATKAREPKMRKRLPPDVRRSLLLEKAAEIILAEGQSALSIEVLAQRAGVSVPLVYHHFKSRAALLLTMFEIYWAEYDKQAATIPRGLPLEEHLKRTFQVYLKVRHKHPAFWRLQPERSVEPEVEAVRSARLEKRTAAWAKFFQRHYGLDHRTAMLAVGMVFGALRAGLDHYFKEGGDPKAIERLGFAFATAGLKQFAKSAPRRGGARRGARKAERSLAPPAKLNSFD